MFCYDAVVSCVCSVLKHIAWCFMLFMFMSFFLMLRCIVSYFVVWKCVVLGCVTLSSCLSQLSESMMKLEKAHAEQLVKQKSIGGDLTKEIQRLDVK